MSTADDRATGAKTPRSAKRPFDPENPANYRTHRLLSREFRQLPTTVMAVTREGDTYPIMPGVAEIERVVELRDVARNLSPGDLIDTNFHVDYQPPNGAQRDAVVSISDMLNNRDPEWPKILGLGARVPQKGLPVVADYLRAVAAGVQPWEQGFAATGLLLRDGREPVYLRQGKPALAVHGVDLSASCELTAGIGDFAGVPALDMDDPSAKDQLANDLLSLLDFSDVVPDQPYIPLGLLGQLMWAPWSGLDRYGRFAVVLAGDSGSRKTTLAGLIIAAQSSVFDGGGPGIEVPVTIPARHNGSSSIGTNRVLYALGGLVAVVDDLFAGQMTGKEIATNWQLVSTIANAAATGMGGAKGSRTGVDVRVDRYARGCPLFTAEALPDEEQHASEVARTAAFLLNSPIDPDRLGRLQGNPRALSRAHAAMIRRGLADLDAPARALATASDLVDGWNVAGHNRARNIYRKIMAGLILFADHLRDAVELDPAALLPEWSDVLAHAADEQARRCGMSNGTQDARDHVRLFVKHLLLLFTEGDLYAAYPAKRQPNPEFPDGVETFQPAEIDGFGPGATGWRQAGIGWTPATSGDPIGAVYVDQGTGRPARFPVALRVRTRAFAELYDRVRDRVTKTEGWPMPSVDVIRRKLTDAGYLAALTTNLWAGENAAKLLVLDLGRMLADDDQADGATFDIDPDAVPDVDPDQPDPAPEAAPPADQFPQVPALLESGPCVRCGLPMLDPAAGQLVHADCGPVCQVCGWPFLVRNAGRDLPMDHAGCTAAPVLAAPVDADQAHDQADAVVDVADSSPAPIARQAAVTPEEAAVTPEEAAVTPKPVADTLKPPVPGRQTAARGRRNPKRGKETTPDTGRGYGRVGALDVDGLHLVDQAAPVAVDLDQVHGVLDLYRLAIAHGLGQLWVTARLADQFGLPGIEQRPHDIPRDAGTRHPFAELDELHHADPAGLAPWSVIWSGENSRDARRTTSRSIVFPHLDDRMPWVTALDGATLVGALTALNLALGNDFYRAPSATVAQLVDRHTRSAKPSAAIMAGQVRPAVELQPERDGTMIARGVYRQTLKGKWCRELVGIEEDHLFVHQFDLNACELLSGANAPLGNEDPPVFQPGLVDFGKGGIGRKSAGYVRIEIEDVPTMSAMLPAWRFAPDANGEIWLAFPDAVLLHDLGKLPSVAETCIWTKSVRALDATQKVLREARIALLVARHQSAASELAYSAFKPIATNLQGHLARRNGPRNENDALWRPDWRDQMQSQAYASMYRQLHEAGKHTGRYPIAVNVDAVFYTSTEHDPSKVLPTWAGQGRAMRLGTGGGQWKHEGCVSLAALREYCGEPQFFKEFARELDRRTGKVTS